MHDAFIIFFLPKICLYNKIEQKKIIKNYEREK